MSSETAAGNIVLVAPPGDDGHTLPEHRPSTVMIRQRPQGFTIALSGCPRVRVLRRTTCLELRSRSRGKERFAFGEVDRSWLVRTPSKPYVRFGQ